MRRLLDLLFPRKCILCRGLLSVNETDLCHECRRNSPDFTKSKRNIPFVAHWTGMWYYKDNVRRSIHRFKFYNARHYAQAYGRLLALRLQQEAEYGFDILSWVPISPGRRFSRGYDQGQLLANAVGRELGLKPMRVLIKKRETPPQSGISDNAHRRANILGAFRVPHPQKVAGKRILLLDDVVTTGATASECAKTLMLAGAKEVSLAAVAAAYHDKKR